MNTAVAPSDRDLGRLEITLLNAAVEAAAACEAWVGKGDKNAADFAAVEAMRDALIRSGDGFRIAIGEGEIDEAPMLRRGEEIGLSSDARWDIAVDPLEGTILCAQGLPGAVTAIAGGAAGTILSAPDMYMAKVMAGPACPPEVVHVDTPVGELIRTYARAANKPVGRVVVCILARERHAGLIEEVRSAGARVKAIEHGDLPAALWVCSPDKFQVDLYLGVGGSPEGILSAVVLKALGGTMSARFEPDDADQSARLAESGIGAGEVLTLDRLVSKDAVFAMASVTGTPSLEPARRFESRVRVEALTVSAIYPPGERLRYRSVEVDPRQHRQAC